MGGEQLRLAITAALVALASEPEEWRPVDESTPRNTKFVGYDVFYNQIDVASWDGKDRTDDGEPFPTFSESDDIYIRFWRPLCPLDGLLAPRMVRQRLVANAALALLEQLGVDVTDDLLAMAAPPEAAGKEDR